VAETSSTSVDYLRGVEGYEPSRPDVELLRQLGEDSCAFEQFYRRHVGTVTRFLARRCTTPEDVADATSATFLAAMLSASTYDPRLGQPVSPGRLSRRPGRGGRRLHCPETPRQPGPKSINRAGRYGQCKPGPSLGEQRGQWRSGRVHQEPDLRARGDLPDPQSRVRPRGGGEQTSEGIIFDSSGNLWVTTGSSGTVERSPGTSSPSPRRYPTSSSTLATQTG
jgi:hypothetical protein